MSRFKGSERRSSRRKSLVTFCPTVFTHSGVEHRALMVNLSQTGAGFRIGANIQEFFLALDEELTYKIETPYGDTTCKAKTIWAKKTNTGYEWGAKFTQRPQSEDDPLSSLLASPF